MSNYRPIPTDCWVKFLKLKKCEPKSVKASHHKWRCPGCIRSIIFWENKKDMPFSHVASNLQSMGIAKEEFLSWLAENCWYAVFHKNAFTRNLPKGCAKFAAPFFYFKAILTATPNTSRIPPMNICWPGLLFHNANARPISTVATTICNTLSIFFIKYYFPTFTTSFLKSFFLFRPVLWWSAPCVSFPE